MKSKRLFQVFVLLVLLLSPLGMSQPARASSNVLAAEIIDRDLDFWDATYIGFVSASMYEKWHFEFTESHNFVITVSTVTGDLVMDPRIWTVF